MRVEETYLAKYKQMRHRWWEEMIYVGWVWKKERDRALYVKQDAPKQCWSYSIYVVVTRVLASGFDRILIVGDRKVEPRRVAMVEAIKNALTFKDLEQEVWEEALLDFLKDKWGYVFGTRVAGKDLLRYETADLAFLVLGDASKVKVIWASDLEKAKRKVLEEIVL